MSKKITLLNQLDPEVQEYVRKMIEQAFIIMVQDAGGSVDIDVSRIDTATVNVRMEFEIINDGKAFRFKTMPNLKTHKG